MRFSSLALRGEIGLAVLAEAKSLREIIPYQKIRVCKIVFYNWIPETTFLLR